MKKIALIFTLVMTMVMSAVAQPKKLSKEDQERFLNAKAQMMQRELHINDAQMEKFLPVYKAFQEELKGIKREKVKGDTLTSEVAYEQVINRLEYQEKVINVQKKVVKELMPVLTPKQLKKFLDVERKVQMDIMKHKMDRRSKKGPHGKGPHDKKGPGPRGDKPGHRAPAPDMD